MKAIDKLKEAQGQALQEASDTVLSFFDGKRFILNLHLAFSSNAMVKKNSEPRSHAISWGQKNPASGIFDADFYWRDKATGVDMTARLSFHFGAESLKRFGSIGTTLVSDGKTLGKNTVDLGIMDTVGTTAQALFDALDK